MGYGSQIAFAFILSVPVACISWTIAQEEFFQEMRNYLVDYQARHRRSWWRRKLAYLPTCPYCLSHYVAGGLVGLLQFKMLADDWRGYVVSLFTLVLIANVYITVYHLLRAGLRYTRLLADRAERSALAIPKQAVSRSSGTASMDRRGTMSMEPRETIPSRQRGALSVQSDPRA